MSEDGEGGMDTCLISYYQQLVGVRAKWLSTRLAQSAVCENQVQSADGTGTSVRSTPERSPAVEVSLLYSQRLLRSARASSQLHQQWRTPSSLATIIFLFRRFWTFRSPLTLIDTYRIVANSSVSKHLVYSTTQCSGVRP